MTRLWPSITTDDEARVIDCLRSGRLWRGDKGRYLPELEARFAALHDARYALAVTNGTHALELALGALGIGFGDEVLVPAFTFIASATAVLRNNALPIPVEIDEDTYCIAPAQILERISARTKAIMPVHWAGHSCDMAAILSIARDRNLRVIEDCAQAHGASCAGRPVGALGDVGTFSFQAGKVMTAGEGGLLLTNDRDLWLRAESLANCGRVSGGTSNSYVRLASNCRMPELLAALLVGQIERLQVQTQRRQRGADLLAEMLMEIEWIEPQGRRSFAGNHPYSLYMLRYSQEAFSETNREGLIQSLSRAGFDARPAHPPFPDVPFFRTLYDDHRQFATLGNRPDFAMFACPTARDLSARTIWLPHSFLLNDEPELRRFVEVLKQSSPRG